MCHHRQNFEIDEKYLFGVRYRDLGCLAGNGFLSRFGYEVHENVHWNIG
mgnify:CR=1 FL=1